MSRSDTRKLASHAVAGKSGSTRFVLKGQWKGQLLPASPHTTALAETMQFVEKGINAETL